jgi:hypothetical protein
MRWAVKILAGFLLTCGLLWAEPPQCTENTLAAYLSLGAGGCTYAGITFANFTYSAKAFGGAAVIGAEQITITPSLVVPSTAVFTFHALWSVTGKQTQDSDISYTAVLRCGQTGTAELGLDLGPVNLIDGVGSVVIHENTNVGNLRVLDECFSQHPLCALKSTDTLEFTAGSVQLIAEHVALAGESGGASLPYFTTSVNTCPLCVAPGIDK